MTNPTPDAPEHQPTFHAHWAHQLRGKKQGLNPQLTTLAYRKVVHERGEVELLICNECHYIEARCLHVDKYYVTAKKKWFCEMCGIDLTPRPEGVQHPVVKQTPINTRNKK